MRGILQAGLTVVAAFAVACAEGPTVGTWREDATPFLAKGGGGGGGTNVSVTVNDQNPGLQALGDPFAVTIPSAGNMQIKPACPSTARNLELVNMGAAIDALGARSICNGTGGKGFVFLTTWSGTSGTGSCSTTITPTGTNFSATSRFFFQVDSDSDGRFDDAQYTIVLVDCWASGTSPTRTVTASAGHLYNQAGVKLDSLAINVNVTY